MKTDLYIALFHHPVYNKEGKIVTTSVTNMDLHDLARNGRTFGVKRVFIVTPSEPQRGMVNYIRTYWNTGFGASYNPSRQEAIEYLEPKSDLKEVYLTIKDLSDSYPHLVATSAKRQEKSVSYDYVSQELQDKPVLLAFGTGYGLTADFMNEVDYVLDPISGTGDYNHLPVRSAVAITLDRLCSKER